MAESSASNDGARNRRPQGRPAGPARSGGSSRGGAGERKPWSRDGKPGERSERGERKPWEQRDGKPRQQGERKPWEQRDGKPRQQGERKPWERRDGKPGEAGERKPWSRDGKPGERSERGERKPWEQRDGKPRQQGERKPWEQRDGKPSGERGERGGRKPWSRDDRPARPRSDSGRGREDERGPRPERMSGPPRDPNEEPKPRHNDPELPDSIKARDLDKSAYAELKGLSKENAERVALHLVAAAIALEADPQLAHQHALAAARTAGRVAVVRETVAITAYECGEYTLALRELRTYRRLSGSNDHIALIVDSERGLGRPERALEEGRAVDRASIPVESRVALAIAMSGARLDLNQPELALGELEIAELDPNRAYSYSPMLFHAYAEVLDELSRAKESAEWRHRAEVAQAALDEAYSDDVIEVFEEIDEAVAAVVDAAGTDPMSDDADEAAEPDAVRAQSADAEGAENAEGARGAE